MMRVDEIWNVLEQETVSYPTGYLTRRILPDVNYDAYIAIEKPSNTRILMLSVSKAFLDREIVYPTSNSFTVNRIVLPQDDEGHGTLQLVLINTRYKDIFTTLVQDIVDHLEAIPEEQPAISAFITRLKRWQTFLEKNNSDGLSEIAQQGLYGELWVLREAILPHFALLTGLQSWTGPKGAQQDFQFTHCAVEVKTTSTKRHQKLSIASERQLDNTGIGTIILLHLSIDVRQGQRETLPQIVTSVRAIVSDDDIARDELENLLFEAGYLDVHSQHYEHKGYIIREQNYFKVGENFPRIVESDLRNGVGDVSYTISVAECKHFSISESEVIALLGD